ncbi:ABC transporter ATP-binding protein [Rhodococcus triatomae]|uniref:Biotin transport system ATP-binding protein n=1 Tax=Rhodococcus triatomae TaxID=300028 RepID=A0A1G8MY44_9NOCA|nr:ABC transporter ATP-binding protein [Rhodococcus triatomae]QNG19123.1 ABC transporter ATP-binding protein [Rhodococcus triatomae]QNG24964.1 ABC transporter ATP-binding protein [Rhodococcus triatomae]SDI72737.1 biotin transport system ATP-binding protein [Rhodococcus triatomae]
MNNVSFRAVGHRYGDRVVLRDVDLALTEHRIGIIGSNGGGKSTLARMINGLVVPTEGMVTVDGLDTRRQGRQIRRKVGFVFTDPNHQIIMPTVAEDIGFSLRRSSLSKQDREAKVATILERFGLAGHADHPTHLLSGGQKQLLALAAVLVTEPDILVADEPTTLLDLRNTRIIADTFAALDQQLVMVTHQLDLLDGFDRVLVVEGGRIVADGEPAETVAFYRGSVR